MSKSKGKTRGKYKKGLSLDELYDIYLQQYNKSEKQVTRAGSHAKYDEMTKSDFIHDFNSVKSDLKAEARKQGKYTKLSERQIAQKLAKDDVYHVSDKEAKIQAEMIYLFNETYGLNTPEPSKLTRMIRQGTAGDYTREFWEDVKSTQKDLRRAGNTWADVKMAIGAQYFGSE